MIAPPKTRRDKVFYEQITTEDQKTIVNTYYVTRQLGKGGFATCYQIKAKKNHQKYAIKVIPKKNTNISKDSFLQKIKNQIKIMSSLNHDGIVKYIKDFDDTENVYIIIELCSQGSLSDIIKNRKYLTQPQIRFLVVQFISILKCLRQNKVIHRDIKLANCFIDHDLKLKLGDFGLATFNNEQFAKKRTVCGTPNYIAPQIIQKKPYSYEVDLWSTGVLMQMAILQRFTLFFGFPPFQTKSCKQTYELIKKCQYQFKGITKNIHISEEAKDFIKNILKLQPQKRLKIDDMMEHPFISNFNIPPRLEFNFSDHSPTSNFIQIYMRPITPNKIIGQKPKRSKTLRAKEKSVDISASKPKLKPLFLYRDIFIKKEESQQATQSIKRNNMIQECIKTQIQMYRTNNKPDLNQQIDERNNASYLKEQNDKLKIDQDNVVQQKDIDEKSLPTKSLGKQPKQQKQGNKIQQIVKEEGNLNESKGEEDLYQQTKIALADLTLMKEGYTRPKIKSGFKPRLINKQQRLKSLLSSSIMIKQWIDLVRNMGIVFILTNFQIGFFFNDKTKMMLSKNNQFIEYESPTEFVSITLGINDDPIKYPTIAKKIIIFRYYANYLRHRHLNQYNIYMRHEAAYKFPQKTTRPFFIKQIFLSNHIVIFKMHNGNIQSYFHDGSFIFISFYSKFLVYNSKNEQVVQMIPLPQKHNFDSIFYTNLRHLVYTYGKYVQMNYNYFEMHFSQKIMLQQMLY